MLTLLHGNNRSSRRQFIQLGGLSALGLNLPALFASQQAQAASARKEVNCILVWLLGGPSHIDMYDLKPDAPAEIRGELNPIRTRTPGVELGELMPNMAACSDKFSIIRSMTSPDPTHGRADHFLMSGNRLTSDLSPPGFGAMLAWQQERQKARQTPPFVQVGTISSPRYGNPGHGGYLGRNYNPFLVDDPNSSSFKVQAFSSPDNVDVGRLSNRQALLAAVDGFQARHETPLPLVRTHDKFTEQAFSMITSHKAKDAFDIQKESDATRDRYGRNRVGQGMLLARRLVEAGVRFVTIKGYIRYGWDHHPEVFPRLRTEVPAYEQGYAALLNDLADRGMMENTLVITAGEFGRTPRLNTDARGPGRDHWNRAFSLTLGGGGIKTGVVLGATDKHAAEVTERPVSVPDFAATVYHALGMKTDSVAHAPDGRPLEALPEGNVVHELIA